MLPWESLPIMRKQEVYRMPSVSVIVVQLSQSCNERELVRREGAAFPLVNPFDAYYVLNPSGDLQDTQAAFEDLFKRQIFEGRQYALHGPPLAYLTAGCPAIIANLWDVISADINQFSKVLLDAWLQGDSQAYNSEAVRFTTFMGEALNVCRFPYLTGAASVCYGVPTILKKNS